MRHMADVIDWWLFGEMEPLNVCGSSCDVIVVNYESDLSHMATGKIKKIYRYKEKCLFISKK